MAKCIQWGKQLMKGKSLLTTRLKSQSVLQIYKILCTIVVHYDNVKRLFCWAIVLLLLCSSLSPAAISCLFPLLPQHFYCLLFCAWFNAVFVSQVKDSYQTIQRLCINVTGSLVYCHQLSVLLMFLHPGLIELSSRQLMCLQISISLLSTVRKA